MQPSEFSFPPRAPMLETFRYGFGRDDFQAPPGASNGFTVLSTVAITGIQFAPSSGGGSYEAVNYNFGQSPEDFYRCWRPRQAPSFPAEAGNGLCGEPARRCLVQYGFVRDRAAATAFSRVRLAPAFLPGQRFRAEHTGNPSSQFMGWDVFKASTGLSINPSSGNLESRAGGALHRHDRRHELYSVPALKTQI